MRHSRAIETVRGHGYRFALGLLRQAGLLRVHRSEADARVLYYGLDMTAMQAAYQQIGASLAYLR